MSFHLYRKTPINGDSSMKYRRKSADALLFPDALEFFLTQIRG